MRIIQSLNPRGNVNYIGGFSSIEKFKSFMIESYAHHKLIGDYKMYTNELGVQILDGIIDSDDIEAIVFSPICNRLKYAGKFDVQGMQTYGYIHVDLDARLVEIPKKSDVYIEKYRAISIIGREANTLKIKHTGIQKLPCSGLIGFSNMDAKDRYIESLKKKYSVMENLPNLTYAYQFWHEEGLLIREILDNKLSVTELKCNHLGHTK